MANSRLCSIPECGKPHKSKGCCRAHYERLLRHGDPLGGRTPDGEPNRWIHEVAMHHTGKECLGWPFGKNTKGYGIIKDEGKAVTASRYLCELAHGAPPTEEHEAAHSCGKGHEGCISPGHLIWKTPKENQEDRLTHGTHSRGAHHARAKLTEHDVRLIISLHGDEPRRKLAKRFGVSSRAIEDIHSGRTWAWLTGVPKPSLNVIVGSNR